MRFHEKHFSTLPGSANAPHVKMVVSQEINERRRALLKSKADRQFAFAISLSVLNHLGRSLYRSFATVLGEAISNSWDADAKKFEIFIHRDSNSFFIKDDGTGMTAQDFQNKFLKIGYSKRKEGTTHSLGGRPFIGRKGIGKLALLSCADKVTVISKIEGGTYIGGTIDNSAR